MASIISHTAVPIGAALALGRRRVPSRLLGVAIVVSMLPDADAIGFWMGIPYEHVFGHRGFTHSLCFAVLAGAVAAAFSRSLGTSVMVAFVTVTLVTTSHGVLDALTDGGLGVAFFSPFSNERYFLPWPVIPVSPIAVSGFLSWGPRILKGEFLPIWVPCLLVGVAGMMVRRLAKTVGR